MLIDVNGTQMWFDVEGASLVTRGARMRERPTVVLVHGGPGGFDHSYFKPDFSRLSEHAQVIYPDLRGHGRSSWPEPEEWSYEICADDLRAFCDKLGIAKPVVYGHSMGGYVAMLYAIRHPGHAAGVVLQSTAARWDVERLVQGFRSVAGEEVAALAGREAGGDWVNDEEWARVFAAFGPNLPSQQQLARRVRNPDLYPRGMALLKEFNVVSLLSTVECPVLVSVGELDPQTPVDASREIFNALPDGLAELKIIEGAGHFPWLDVPDSYWPMLVDFVMKTTQRAAARP